MVRYYLGVIDGVGGLEILVFPVFRLRSRRLRHPLRRLLETILIAGIYQHLAEEPRSLSTIILLALFFVLLLLSAASFSVMTVGS